MIEFDVYAVRCLKMVQFGKKILAGPVFNCWRCSFCDRSGVASVMFIFDRCRHSWAVATPVKYENDTQEVSSVLIIPKKRENNRMLETDFINPCLWLRVGSHDDVIKWKHFPLYWPFVRGIHRSTVNSHTRASDAELWCFRWSASE